MAGFLRTLKNAIRGAKSASQVVPILRGVFAPYVNLQSADVLRISKDEFIQSYLYGSLSFFVHASSITDQAEIGFTLWQSFEQLLPGLGKQMLENCNMRLQENNPGFKQGVRAGWKETQEMGHSQGLDGFPSLEQYLAANYNRG